jgi:hypothetical protein
MTHAEAHPLNPRTYLRHRIVNLRREVKALQSETGASRWLAQGQAELQILEAELAAIERRRER